MSRWAEIERAYEDARAKQEPADIAMVDQAQAALTRAVRDLAGADLADHREPIGAALYVLFDTMRTARETFDREHGCANPYHLADLVDEMVEAAREGLMAVIGVRQGAA